MNSKTKYINHKTKGRRRLNLQILVHSTIVSMYFTYPNLLLYTLQGAGTDGHDTTQQVSTFEFQRRPNKHLE
jgi:hypothetical protein